VFHKKSFTENLIIIIKIIKTRKLSWFHLISVVSDQFARMLGPKYFLGMAVLACAIVFSSSNTVRRNNAPKEINNMNHRPEDTKPTQLPGNDFTLLFFQTK